MARTRVPSQVEAVGEQHLVPPPADALEHRLGGPLVEIDRAGRRLRLLEDGVPDLLRVDAGLADDAEDVREHADLVEVADDEPRARRRPPGDVHAARHLPRPHEGLDDPDRLAGDGVLRLLGRRTDVVRAVDTRELRERAVELGLTLLRLSGEHVGRDADPAGARGLEERVLVDDLRPRGVHERGAGAERRQHLARDEAARLLREREVEREEVRRAREREEVRRALDAGLAGALVVERARPGDDAHPEREAAARSAATASGILRSSARTRPIASSATAIEFCPGQFATNTPRRDAAATSIVFTPAPARTTSESAGAPSKTSAETCFERTTRIDAPRAAAGSSPAATSGRWSTSSPSAASGASCSFGNASATRMRMGRS